MEQKKNFYISVTTKFHIALIIAILWVGLCTYISLPWIEELAEYVSLPLSLIIIALIALIPGFLNMFILVSFVVDDRPQAKPLETYPPISILMAAYNEENNIIKSIQSVLDNKYLGEMELIVIDDGSTDNTVRLIKEMAHSKVKLLQPPHGGKAAALNFGLAHSTHEIIVTVDADMHLHKEALNQIVSRFKSDPPNTAAVAGSVYVKNSRTSFFTRIQEWDYFLGIAAIKRMQSLFQGTLVAQGAFSLFTKKSLQEMGGWKNTVGEDIVLTWGLIEHGYRVGYAERAISFTTTPITYKYFFNQRSRWARGLIEAFHYHPRNLIRPRLSTLFIYWNLLFPLMDLTYLLVFMPGVIAAFFGYYFIAGPMTLMVLPLSLLFNYFMIIRQKRLFADTDLKLRENILGFIFYWLIYNFVMLPACVVGYFLEFLRFKKRWGTK